MNIDLFKSNKRAFKSHGEDKKTLTLDYDNLEKEAFIL